MKQGCLLLILVGCVDPNAPSEELLSIQDTTWLVRSVQFPEGGDRFAPGIDLDGRDSGFAEVPADATCEELSFDYASPLDPDELGVDNAGQSLIQAGQALTDDGRTFQGEIDRAVREGQIRWAISLGAIDEDAGTLAVRLLRIDDGEEIAIDSLGPTADQSLRATEVASTAIAVRGSIASGSIETTELGGGPVFLIPFDDLHVGGLSLVASDREHLALELGGTFSVQALAQRSVDEGEGLTLDDFMPIFEAVADMQPREAHPTQCDRVSAGFALEAVPVELIE